MENLDAKPDSRLFNCIFELAKKKGVVPIQGWWDTTIDGKWTIGMNGTYENIKSLARNCQKVPSPPFCFVLWYKGNYIGLCHPKWTMLVTGTATIEVVPDDGLIGKKNKGKEKKSFGVEELEEIIKRETRGS